MSDSSWTIRVAGPDDAEFIADMLMEAVNWPPERTLSREQILSTPELAHYVTEWPRHDDLGVIAEANGQPVGAAWLRLFPASDPGYGFVAADVPELSIGVAAPWRGCALAWLRHGTCPATGHHGPGMFGSNQEDQSLRGAAELRARPVSR